jgi:hypothetical protein
MDGLAQLLRMPGGGTDLDNDHFGLGVVFVGLRQNEEDSSRAALAPFDGDDFTPVGVRYRTRSGLRNRAKRRIGVCQRN